MKKKKVQNTNIYDFEIPWIHMYIHLNMDKSELIQSAKSEVNT